jgi:predicted MFS family arabinose efflux permease
MNKPRLWTKDFIVISFLGFFACSSFNLLLVITSVYTMDTFHSSPSAAGLATGIFVIGSIVGRIFIGKWTEIFGRKRMLATGLIFYLIMMTLYFVANSYVLLLTVRFFHGAAFGILFTAANAIAVNIIPRERLGEGTAYYSSISITLAVAIGPFLGIFIRQHGSYDMIFLVCIICTVLSLVMMLILSVPEVKLTEDQRQETKKFKLSGLVATKAIPVAVIVFLVYFSYSSVITFLSPYSEEINLMESASVFFITFAAAVIISRPFVGRMFDMQRENVVMYPAFICLILGLIMLSQTQNGFILLLSAFLMGLGVGNILSIGQTIAVKAVPKHKTGLAISTYHAAMDAGVGIGPYILGIFVPLAGYSGVYLIAAILPLTCMYLYYQCHGNKTVLERSKAASLNKY